MKKFILILCVFSYLSSTAQFEMTRSNIKYTKYSNEVILKEYWKNTNEEIDDIEGIYEPLSGDTSILGYVLGIIKVDDYYEIIMLGQPYGSKDVTKGGVKATLREMPAQDVYQSRWRMANARIIEKGFFIKKNSVITLNNTRYPGRESSYVKIFDPGNNTQDSKTKNSIGWSGNGSGIIISKLGHIVTNYHVIEDANDIEVEFILNDEVQKFNAEIVQVDKVNDLAIIKIVDINFDGVDELPYNFKTRTSDVGTKVYAFGYPMALTAMGKEIKITDGIISSKSGFDGDITTYQITAPIQGGNSGGPLFDEKGNLLGINSSGIDVKVADNVAYTIKSSYILNLIDVMPKNIDLPSNTKLQSLPLTEQIKEITKYVVLIKVK